MTGNAPELATNAGGALVDSPADPPVPAAPAIVRAADTTPGTEASRPWAVRMRGVGKRYNLGELKSLNENFREDLVNWTRGLFKRGAREKYESFWALRDIDLDVERGDTVGIIGRNGAGKSTLLKILSRITQPTTGELRYRGRLASLLEVGTGFHRELTGRENIYLNGAILGMTRPEINAAFNDIVEFAGVEKFLDTPVKRYSSGMYVRLAFAVAAHLRTDILVVDEVLAVGDAEFQKKCLGKMQDVAHDGRTVFFVSHNMGAVARLCKRAVLLKEGRSLGLMDATDAIKLYTSERGTEYNSDLLRLPRVSRPAVSPILTSLRIHSAGSEGNVIAVGASATFELTLANTSSFNSLMVGIILKDSKETRVASFQSQIHSNLEIRGIPEDQQLECRIQQLPLVPDSYSIELAISDGGNVIERIEDAGSLIIQEADFLGTGRLPNPSHGPIILRADWSLREGVA